MGCGLSRLRRSEERPGKIYSTLRRPQVETKVGVAYTYRFLDFLLGNAEGPGSLPCLASVRELPGQLEELYIQGFLLAALHPLIHPCAPPACSLQSQLYRAVLIRPTHSVERSGHCCRLDLDVCQPLGQFPDYELIQGCVKKAHDAAEQGSMLVGFLQQVSMVTAVPGRGYGEDSSLSLHSSPSSFLRAELDQNQNLDQNQTPDPNQSVRDLPEKPPNSPAHEEEPTGPVERVELFSLFNQQGALCVEPVRFYTVRVPLRLGWRDRELSRLEAGWLDHMTQHFRSGASLVDGYFHLGTQPSGGVLPETVEGVFVFQEGAESDYPAASAFDAIVVEQCTVIHGVQVKTDYVPLLQSLALYGWRLTCVLPTPIANGNSDGSVCTKQILFLQRPVLQRKRENRKLSLSLRGKNRAVKKATPTAPAAAPPTAPPKGPETERWGQQGPIEGPEREERAEREEREEGGRVGRMNDKNRLNETEEREAELGAEPGSAALQSGGNPENCWAGLMDESAVGGVSGQLGGAEDGPTASTNQRLGMVDGGGVREASDSDCILVT